MKRILCAALAAALAACTTASPDVIHPYEAQHMSPVYDATVLSVRPVTIDGSQSGIGATAGAVAGGVAGSTVGGHNEQIVVGVLGAVIGGILGNAVERGTTQQHAVEIMVQMRNGERRAIVQGVGNETWAPGDAVVLVTTNGRTRVSHAPMVVPAPQPAPVSQPVPSYQQPPLGQPVPPRS